MRLCTRSINNSTSQIQLLTVSSRFVPWSPSVTTCMIYQSQSLPELLYVVEHVSGPLSAQLQPVDAAYMMTYSAGIHITLRETQTVPRYKCWICTSFPRLQLDGIHAFPLNPHVQRVKQALKAYTFLIER